MKFLKTPLEGAYTVELEPFKDERGIFARTFCKKEFEQIGFVSEIVQINHSVTVNKGAIRGMHFQIPPAAEIKIIRCVNGAVFDVMVDIRKNSPTFLKWHGVELSKENMRMVYIPKGFAHGFQTLTNNAELIYHHTEFYNPKHESGLKFNDPALKIAWPLALGTVSEKDKSYPLLENNFKGIEI